jgi:Fic family protein
MEGKMKPSSYRDGQNVIRESGSGNIIYMPPESKDVVLLMGELVGWVNDQLAEKEFPAPLIAGIAHYQFATIHPYYDGNGRTARLLTNLIHHLSGYGLKGIYSLEGYYARNLEDYYSALSVGSSHNYYLGRAEADISHWVEYFCHGMADSFYKVRKQADKLKSKPDQTKQLRELDARKKRVLVLFKESRYLTTREMAGHLGVSARTALNLCNRWVESDFLIQHGELKTRKYELAENWTELL